MSVPRVFACKKSRLIMLFIICDTLCILVSGLGTSEIEKRKRSYDMDMVHLPLLAFPSMASKAMKDNVKVDKKLAQSKYRCNIN